MAYSRSHINTCGSFNTGEKSALLKTFDEINASAGGGLDPQTAPAALTVSTGGTASNTLASFAGTDYATDGPVIRNSVNSLGTKLNALITALTAAGVFE